MQYLIYGLIGLLAFNILAGAFLYWASAKRRMARHAEHMKKLEGVWKA